jgi:hypothetical protein
MLLKPQGPYRRRYSFNNEMGFTEIERENFDYI